MFLISWGRSEREELMRGSVTSIKKVDFLAHYDYNTNKYKPLQSEYQPDLFIFVWGNRTPQT
jgi:hypothetical protein